MTLARHATHLYPRDLVKRSRLHVIHFMPLIAHSVHKIWFLETRPFDMTMLWHTNYVKTNKCTIHGQTAHWKQRQWGIMTHLVVQ